MSLGGSDDRAGDGAVLQHPGQRHLHVGNAPRLGDPTQHLDDLVVGLAVVEAGGELVGAGPFGIAFADIRPAAGQEAARQRRPRDHPHALVLAQRQHLPLFLAVDQVVLRLHRHERRPAVGPRDAQHLHELPGVHRAGADVAGLAGAHDVVQRLQRLLDRRLIVEPVDLVEVDIVDAQPAQRPVDAVQDVLARQAAVVGIAAHRPVDLGGDHHLVPLGVFLQRLAGHPLALALGIDIGGVEEVDPGLHRTLEERQRRLLVQHPRPPLGGAIGHAAQTQARNLQAGVAKANIVHRISPVSSRPEPHLRPSRPGGKADFLRPPDPTPSHCHPGKARSGLSGTAGNSERRRL